MSTGSQQNSKESTKKRRPKLNQLKLAKSQRSLVQVDSERRRLREVETMPVGFVDQYLCRVEDQFFDDVTGLCGMCEDICRPQHMDISECQAKCSKYYRERMNGIHLKSSIGSLVAGTPYILNAQSMSDIPVDSRHTPRMEASALLPMEGQSHYSQSGGESFQFVVIVLIAMVITLVIILVVTVTVVVICKRKGIKGCRRSTSETSERNVERAPLNYAASSNASTDSAVSDKQKQFLDPVVVTHSPPVNSFAPSRPVAHKSYSPPAYSRSPSRDTGCSSTSGVDGGAKVTQGGLRDENRIELEDDLQEEVKIPPSFPCTERYPD